MFFSKKTDFSDFHYRRYNYNDLTNVNKTSASFNIEIENLMQSILSDSINSERNWLLGLTGLNI